MIFGKLKQSSPSGIERRKTIRQRVLFGSKIAYSGCDFLINCRVRDFSPGGAGITLDSQHPIPDSVYLIEFQSLLVYEASVAWRRMPEFGLRFVRTYRRDEVPSETLRELISRELQPALAK